MDFGKYIHELLLENEIVIIPGFGAFVSEYKPAEISEDSDEIKPPSKIVTFNQQIRNNDGLLVGYVAERHRSSHFDALKRIEKEREDILYKLDNGEQVELHDIGVLFYTEDSTIAFNAEEDENLLLDSFGLETTTIDSVEETEDITEEEPLDPPVVEEEKTEESEPEPEPEPEPEQEVVEAVVTSTELAEEEKIEEIIDEPVPITKPVTEHEIEPESEILFPMIEPMPEKQKKKRGWWWLLLILVPLIAVSVFIFMKGEKDGKLDKQKVLEQQTTRIEEPVVIPQVDTVKTDTIQIEEKYTVNPEDIKPEPVFETDPDTPKYYLVGGSFSVEENAETYLQELKAKGFDAFHVGKKGRFFIIGIGTYATFREVENARQDYMTNNPGSEVWVWKK